MEFRIKNFLICVWFQLTRIHPANGFINLYTVLLCGAVFSNLLLGSFHSLAKSRLYRSAKHHCVSVDKTIGLRPCVLSTQIQVCFAEWHIPDLCIGRDYSQAQQFDVQTIKLVEPLQEHTLALQAEKKSRICMQINLLSRKNCFCLLVCTILQAMMIDDSMGDNCSKILPHHAVFLDNQANSHHNVARDILMHYEDN